MRSIRQGRSPAWSSRMAAMSRNGMCLNSEITPFASSMSKTAQTTTSMFTPGSPVFLSSNIDTAVYQPAQHWLMTSHRPVNDGAFSTVFTDIPPSATTSDGVTATMGSAVSTMATTNGNSDSDIPAGASAAIGIGAGLLFMGLTLGSFFVWRRRRRRRNDSPVSYRSESAMGGFSQEKSFPVPPCAQIQSHSHVPPSNSEFPPPQEVHSSSAPQEMSAESRHELDSGPDYHRITGHESNGRLGL